MNFPEIQSISRFFTGVYQIVVNTLASLSKRIGDFALSILGQFQKTTPIKQTPAVLEPQRVTLVEGGSAAAPVAASLLLKPLEQASPLVHHVEEDSDSSDSEEEKFKPASLFISDLKVEANCDWIRFERLSEFEKQFLTQVLQILENGDSNYGIKFTYEGKSGLELVPTSKNYENRIFCKKNWEALLEKKRDLDTAFVPRFAQLRFKEILSWPKN